MEEAARSCSPILPFRVILYSCARRWWLLVALYALQGTLGHLL